MKSKERGRGWHFRTLGPGDPGWSLKFGSGWQAVPLYRAMMRARGKQGASRVSPRGMILSRAFPWLEFNPRNRSLGPSGAISKHLYSAIALAATRPREMGRGRKQWSGTPLTGTSWDSRWVAFSASFARGMQLCSCTSTTAEHLTMARGQQSSGAPYDEQFL